MKCIWYIISYSAMQFAFWASLYNRIWEGEKKKKCFTKDSATTAASEKRLLGAWHQLWSSVTERIRPPPATSDDVRGALRSLLRSWPERYADSLRLVFRMRQMLQTFYSCLHSCLPAHLDLEPLVSGFTELLATPYCHYGQTHRKQSLSN